MQIQSASIPSSTPSARPSSTIKQAPAPTDAVQSQPSPVARDKPDARSVTQDRTDTASNSQFAPVSAPISSTATNASFATNRDGTASNKPINQYQQMANQAISNEKNAQSDLFGVDVYV